MLWQCDALLQHFFLIVIVVASGMSCLRVSCNGFDADFDEIGYWVLNRFYYYKYDIGLVSVVFSLECIICAFKRRRHYLRVRHLFIDFFELRMWLKCLWYKKHCNFIIILYIYQFKKKETYTYSYVNRWTSVFVLFIFPYSKRRRSLHYELFIFNLLNTN